MTAPRPTPHTPSQTGRTTRGGLWAIVAVTVTVFVAGGVTGCPAAEDQGPPPVDLVVLDDREAWAEIVDAASDPFVDHRPATVGCIDATWIAEAGGLELSTELCSYIALEQPSLAPLSAGDTIHLEVFHFDLTAPSPTQAHWAIAIGDEVVWSMSPPVPSAAGYFSEDIVLATDHPQGTPVVVHLHNHGQNTYGVKLLQRL